jgi:hypothetical protein
MNEVASLGSKDSWVYIYRHELPDGYPAGGTKRQFPAILEKYTLMINLFAGGAA